MKQQPTNDGAIRDNVIQLLQPSVLKQRNLNDKISHEEISRLINDIISLSEDNTGELRRSKRSKKCKKGSSKQHAWNKWNTEKLTLPRKSREEVKPFSL
ncbi:hypothetical protein [Wolbachia endosymbiont of Oedothorax gibbosus]|uniref:hypothetical protein n=1 Tax=Wolbachia endosymbiont of Oedothorax gibbosus TaxID=931100 RepID=UPI002024928A|nr:hypothetical protein [Wolbachia endosymbiont of Oedothorax gibbosus]